MQGRDVLDKSEEMTARDWWSIAYEDAIVNAQYLAKTGAHKQIVNRLLAPFAHITVVISSTEWDGFLAQRDHADAEPHMQMLAKEIRNALDWADVQTLQPSEWHLPFVTEKDCSEHTDIGVVLQLEAMKVLSVARCASTSYKTVDGFDMTLDRAQEIYDKLLNADPIHASPFEHVARADEAVECAPCGYYYGNQDQHRNFTGFCQLRAMIEDER